MELNIKTNIGVYLLKKGDDVVYVGQSRNLLSRLSVHYSSGKDFDNVEVIECTLDELDNLEHDYMKKHNPVYNIKNSNKYKSFNVFVTDLKNTYEVSKNDIKKILTKFNAEIRVFDFMVYIDRESASKTKKFVCENYKKYKREWDENGIFIGRVYE